MVANWPEKIKNPTQYNGLINLNDFYATFCDILEVKNESDGKSFMDVFSNDNSTNRETTTIYYDPHHHNRSKVSTLRNVFTQDARYKFCLLYTSPSPRD